MAVTNRISATGRIDRCFTDWAWWFSIVKWTRHGIKEFHFKLLKCLFWSVKAGKPVFSRPAVRWTLPPLFVALAAGGSRRQREAAGYSSASYSVKILNGCSVVLSRHQGLKLGFVVNIVSNISFILCTFQLASGRLMLQALFISQQLRNRHNFGWHDHQHSAFFGHLFQCS